MFQSILSTKLYQLRKQTSTYVILIVAFVMAIFSAFAASVMYGNVPFFRNVLDTTITYLKAYGNLTDSTGYIASFFEYLSQNVITDKFFFLSTALTSDGLTLFILFTFFNVIRGKKDGFEKMLMPLSTPGIRFLADGLILLGYAFILNLVTTIPFICMSFVSIQDIGFFDIGSYLLYFTLKTLLLTVVGLLIVAFLDILPKKKLSFIFVIAYVFLLFSSLYDFFTMILQNVMNVNLYADYAFPMGSFLYLTMGDTNLSISSIVVVVLYTALAFVLEFVVTKKKDMA